VPVCVCVCVCVWPRGVGCDVWKQDVFTKFGRELSGEVLPVNGRLGGHVR